MKQGVQDEKNIMDYVGFRTYDSIIRIHKVFGQTNFTVISQDFHNRRAIFIANHETLNAIGYNAEDVNFYNGFKTKLREKFAHVKVFVDLLYNNEPKFIGKPIEIK